MEFSNKQIEYMQFIHYMMFTPTERIPNPPVATEHYLELGVQIKELLKSGTISIESMNSKGQYIIRT